MTLWKPLPKTHSALSEHYFRFGAILQRTLWKNALLIGSDPAEKIAPEVNQRSQADDAIAIQQVINKASELIEVRIAKLTWEQMQELVKEILAVMGYRACVSPKVAERGIDIFASPDGLGLHEPRISVEVKHRLGSSMSSSEIRLFFGGRQPGDRCLYVSTGGFTKDAKYEAERSTTPLTLISPPQLADRELRFVFSIM